MNFQSTSFVHSSEVETTLDRFTFSPISKSIVSCLLQSNKGQLHSHGLAFLFRIREKSMGTQTKIADVDERDVRNEAVIHIKVAVIPHAEQESSHVPN